MPPCWRAALATFKWQDLVAMIVRTNPRRAIAEARSSQHDRAHRTLEIRLPLAQVYGMSCLLLGGGLRASNTKRISARPLSEAFVDCASWVAAQLRKAVWVHSLSPRGFLALVGNPEPEGRRLSSRTWSK